VDVEALGRDHHHRALDERNRRSHKPAKKPVERHEIAADFS
jgi:hypothetical protein